MNKIILIFCLMRISIIAQPQQNDVNIICRIFVGSHKKIVLTVPCRISPMPKSRPVRRRQ